MTIFLPVHPAAELFPRMTPDELRTLGENILEHELTSAIVLWRATPEGQAFLLDGRNRLDAIEIATGHHVEVVAEDERWIIDAGTFISDKVIVLNNTVDPYVYVISANIHRRHLTAEQKRELIGKLIKAQPEKSDLQIAKTAKAGHPTVARVRKKLEAKGDVERRSTRTDTKGRQQPARKPPKQRDLEKERRAREILKLQRRDGLPSAEEMMNADDDKLKEIFSATAIIEKLHEELRAAKIKITGLESEVEEARAAAKPTAKPPPRSKPALRCSICHEKKRAVLRPVFICDACVDIHEVREAAPPDDGRDIPERLRREPAR